MHVWGVFFSQPVPLWFFLGVWAWTLFNLWLVRADHKHPNHGHFSDDVYGR